MTNDREGSRLEAPDEQAVTARLAGAGSMRAELEHVLAAVPEDRGPDDYRRAILDDNAAQKGSANGRMWAWKRLKLRYGLDRPDTVEFRAFRRAMRDPSAAGRGLSAMLMFARLDRLFREVTLEVLAPRLSTPGTVVTQEAVRQAVEARMAREGLNWSRESLASTTNHLASSWKDFGLVEGSRTRRVTPPRPSHATVRFAVELGRATGLTDRQVLDSPWFALVGLDRPRAESALYEAARDGAITYRSQADVIEIGLPAGDGLA